LLVIYLFSLGVSVLAWGLGVLVIT